MGEKVRKFMMGRYGNDQLNRFLLVICLILLVLSCFDFWAGFMFLGLLGLVLAYVRMLSRNIYKRQAENLKYLQITGKLRGEMRYLRAKIRDRKTYDYFRCPSCGTPMRLPKGKGRVVVTCRNCKHEFERQS